MFARGLIKPAVSGIPPVLDSPTTRSRKNAYAARDILRGSGHLVIHNTSILPPVDIIAWQEGGDPLLVQVRRTRRPLVNAHDVARRFHTDLGQLRGLSKPRNARLQVWLFHKLAGWKTYDVYPGGIMENTF